MTPAATHARAARASLPVVSERRSSAAVTMSAPPTAWTQRAASRTANDGAIPHTSEAAANTTVPMANAATGRLLAT